MKVQLDKTAFRDDRIDQLNSWQETLFHRILIYVGDGDEMPADPKFIRDTLFPLKHTLRTTQVDSALNALYSANLIGLGTRPDSRPYLWIIRPLDADSLRTAQGGEGTRRGGKDNKYINNKGRGENEDTDKANVGIADEFGITDDEVEKHRKDIQAIEDEAKEYGLNTSIGSLRYAMSLANEYGTDEVISAIRQCIDTPKWRYVGAILRSAREEGRKPGDAPRKSTTRGHENISEIDYSGTEISKWWGEEE